MRANARAPASCLDSCLLHRKTQTAPVTLQVAGDWAGNIHGIVHGLNRQDAADARAEGDLLSYEQGFPSNIHHMDGGVAPQDFGTRHTGYAAVRHRRRDELAINNGK